MNIAIFGGSFNPVHRGHLDMARAAHESLGYDKVVFVPAARSPFKNGVPGASALDRYLMLCLAVKDMPFAAVSTIELTRPEPSYTIDTVMHFAASMEKGDKLGLLIGTDQAERLQEWKDWELILGRVHLVVFDRHASGDRRIIRYPCTYMMNGVHETSSTAIREDVCGRLIDVPREVGEYILSKGLYKK